MLLTAYGNELFFQARLLFGRKLSCASSGITVHRMDELKCLAGAGRHSTEQAWPLLPLGQVGFVRGLIDLKRWQLQTTV
jgi:hypothetical protein